MGSSGWCECGLVCFNLARLRAQIRVFPAARHAKKPPDGGSSAQPARAWERWNGVHPRKMLREPCAPGCRSGLVAVHGGPVREPFEGACEWVCACDVLEHVNLRGAWRSVCASSSCGRSHHPSRTLAGLERAAAKRVRVMLAFVHVAGHGAAAHAAPHGTGAGPDDGVPRMPPHVHAGLCRHVARDAVPGLEVLTLRLHSSTR